MSFIIWDECKDITDDQWNKIEIKFGTIEERIDMQIKNAIIEYVSDKMDAESVKKKPKPYYRKGRWE
ncbi:hypothetical protein [Robertmurraya sp.]|uniref:hypothetical protein n=1 Tax=Robertmurraya sp. TaxID=2837525 RepID=UPI003703984F